MSRFQSVEYFAVVVVPVRWTVDIGLESSVLEHLTSDAGVPSSIPSPAIFFYLYYTV